MCSRETEEVLVRALCTIADFSAAVCTLQGKIVAASSVQQHHARLIPNELLPPDGRGLLITQIVPLFCAFVGVKMLE